MRPQPRKLPSRILLVAFVLLLLIETANFAWACSYTRAGGGSLALTQGQVSVTWYSSTYSPRFPVVHAVGWRAESVPYALRGPRWADQLPRWKTGGSIRFVIIPLWPLILATGAAAFWTHRRSLRLPGHCPKCRYDLRATPPSAQGALICPECGHTSPAPPAANNPLHEGPP